MKKKIFACVSAFAMAAMASVTAFAYSVKPNKQSNEIVIVGENGIYSSASELSGLTEIKLTASTDHEYSDLSGCFKVICDDETQKFNWTLDNGDDVVFKINDDSMYEAVIEGIKIPEKCNNVILVFENGNENTLDLVGVELVGVDEPKKTEPKEPSDSDVSSETSSSDVSSESSSEMESSSEITESSSQTETSSDRVRDENDNSNKSTGVGAGLAFAGIAIAAAAVVSLKKSK